MHPRTLVWTDDTREAIVAEASGILARGGLVAMPTETVYGLAARADSAEACARIYQAKRRPLSHPLIVHVAGVEAARALVLEHAHEVLAVWGNRFWPGPLTLVLPRSPRVLDAVTGGGPNVALRCSAHPVMAAVLANMPFGLAAPSANRYQGVSPTTAAHVAQSLGMACDLSPLGRHIAVDIRKRVAAHHRDDRVLPALKAAFAREGAHDSGLSFSFATRPSVRVSRDLARVCSRMMRTAVGGPSGQNGFRALFVHHRRRLHVARGGPPTRRALRRHHLRSALHGAIRKSRSESNEGLP